MVSVGVYFSNCLFQVACDDDVMGVARRGEGGMEEVTSSRLLCQRDGVVVEVAVWNGVEWCGVVWRGVARLLNITQQRCQFIHPSSRPTHPPLGRLFCPLPPPTCSPPVHSSVQQPFFTRLLPHILCTITMSFPTLVHNHRLPASSSQLTPTLSHCQCKSFTYFNTLNRSASCSANFSPPTQLVYKPRLQSTDVW
ncbi:hypothetical protein TcWFU_007245 [Taenia crassiceps]|uniref:Uncharacterized protein n=1 Tax=Taenia crassiceps TaxID=6207 RepID=A0ABR4Q5M0_9CEST